MFPSILTDFDRYRKTKKTKNKKEEDDIKETKTLSIFKIPFSGRVDVSVCQRSHGITVDNFQYIDFEHIYVKVGEKKALSGREWNETKMVIEKRNKQKNSLRINTNDNTNKSTDKTYIQYTRVY